jgi:hypothetical protein
MKRELKELWRRLPNKKKKLRKKLKRLQLLLKRERVKKLSQKLTRKLSQRKKIKKLPHQHLLKRLKLPSHQAQLQSSKCNIKK